ncbi:MAG TPA: amidohydrolase family protein, partial [Gammaproteobacteria bacterium]|nr:amidohydrolase family protein [Gammaproteobacteria bacterium]
MKLNVRGGAIDVHHHFVPPGGATNRPWSPEMSLEQMDKFGIAVAILSMTQNGELLYNGGEKGRSAVRAGNEYGAELMQKHPDKFGLLGGIPMPDIEGSLREVEYAYDVLKVDGIGIYTNDNRGRWPGDPYFEPLWQELDRRNAIVYMHEGVHARVADPVRYRLFPGADRVDGGPAARAQAVARVRADDAARERG